MTQSFTNYFQNRRNTLLHSCQRCFSLFLPLSRIIRWPSPFFVEGFPWWLHPLLGWLFALDQGLPCAAERWGWVGADEGQRFGRWIPAAGRQSALLVWSWPPVHRSPPPVFHVANCKHTHTRTHTHKSTTFKRKCRRLTGGISHYVNKRKSKSSLTTWGMNCTSTLRLKLTGKFSLQVKVGPL